MKFEGRKPAKKPPNEARNARGRKQGKTGQRSAGTAMAAGALHTQALLHMHMSEK